MEPFEKSCDLLQEQKVTSPSIHELSEFLSRDKSPQKKTQFVENESWIVMTFSRCVRSIWNLCHQNFFTQFLWGKKKRSRTPQMTWRWRSLALRPDMRHGCCFKKLGVIGVLSLVKQQKVQTFWDLLAIIFTHGLWLMFYSIQVLQMPCGVALARWVLVDKMW